MSTSGPIQIYFTLVILHQSDEEKNDLIAQLIYENEGFSNVIFDVSMRKRESKVEKKQQLSSKLFNSFLSKNKENKNNNNSSSIFSEIINLNNKSEHKEVDIFNQSDVDCGEVWSFQSFINYAKFIAKVKGIGPFLIYKVYNKNENIVLPSFAAEHPLCSRVIIVTDAADVSSMPEFVLKKYLSEHFRWKFMNKSKEEARTFLTESQDGTFSCSIKSAKNGTRYASEKFYSLRKTSKKNDKDDASEAVIKAKPGDKDSKYNRYNFSYFEFYSWNSAEDKYLKLIRRILKDPAPIKLDRTGTGTKSIFAPSISFKLYRMSFLQTSFNDDRSTVSSSTGDDNEVINKIKSLSPKIHRRYRAILPLLTTKTVLFKSIYEELLWFLSGDTDAKNLAAKGVNIWNANSSKEALNNLPEPMKSYQEGQCGPIYGHQWRNFNSEGIDQIKNIIHLLKTDPTSRRMVLTAWNPAQLNKMCLPPCHILSVFYTKKSKKGDTRSGRSSTSITSKTEDSILGLYCHLTMRSSDVGLGLPFNIASYSLLTHMLALCAGMRARQLKITMVDCHIYQNHIISLEEQLLRPPIKTFPQIMLSEKIAQKVLDCSLSIDDFDSDDIKINNYFPDPFIKMKMAV
jgi:thymidylate synthase